MTDLNGNVYKQSPGMIFTDKTGERVPIVDVQLDAETSEIAVLIDDMGNIISPEDVIYQRYTLYVPGVGTILPGSRVIWKERDYVLQFGWHTNVSNQTLFTWYLEPLEGNDLVPKTLYQWMIKEIELVHFR